MLAGALPSALLDVHEGVWTFGQWQYGADEPSNWDKEADDKADDLPSAARIALACDGLLVEEHVAGIGVGGAPVAITA